MEQSSLANDSSRQGRGQVQPAIELAGGPNQHVGRNPGAPERHIGSATAAECWRCVVRHDDHNVVVAVRPGVTPGDGTEDVDALRAVRFHQTAHHLGQNRIAGRRSLEDSGVIESHGSSLTQFAITGRMWTRSDTGIRENYGGTQAAVLFSAWLVPVFDFLKTALLSAMVSLAPAAMAMLEDSETDP